MGSETPSDRVRRLLRNGNAVTVGTAVLVEITRRQALEAACTAIEAIGGQVLSISERAPSRNGKNQRFTVYSVVAVLPQGAIDNE